MASVYAIGAPAQTVMIRNGLGENGFGWMFLQGGTCYAVLPRHVAGPFPRVTVTTAAPVTSGTGTVIAPFWEGIDLAIAVVRGEAEASCVESLDGLKNAARERRAVAAVLLRLLPSGEEERLDLRIEGRSYLTFDAVIEGGREIAQGTSGAFAFVGEVPVGMAVSSTDPSRATFMRSEEIFLNLQRYLAEQGGAYAAPKPSLDENGAGSGTTGGDEGAIVLGLDKVSVPPINPTFAPENLLEPGLFVFERGPLTRIVLNVQGEAAATLRRIRIVAPADGEYALPKTILVQYSVEAEGNAFREWTRGQMAPDGLFDSGTLAPRNVRRVALTVLDAWAPGPLAIDQVIAD
jgi:hypothetical protein